MLLLLVTVGIQFGQWESAQATPETLGAEAGQVVDVGPASEAGIAVGLGGPPLPGADSGPLNKPEAQLRREAFLRDGVPDLLTLLRGMGLVLGALLVAGAIGGEYSWGTLRPVLTCVPSRGHFIGAQLLALGILLVLALAMALAAGLVTRVVITAVDGGVELGFLDGGYALDAFFDFGRLVAVLVPYLLIVALATVAARSAMVGVGVGLIAIVIDAVASEVLDIQPTWVRHIPEFMLRKNADAVFGRGISTIAEGPPDPWIGALVLAAYAMVCLVGIFIVFYRRDVTA